MTAKRLDGKALAKKLRADLKATIDTRTAEGKRPPSLAVILVGEDPASKIYVRNKDRAAKQAGIEVRTIRLDASTDRETLLGLIRELNADDGVDGILCQLPLPDHLDPNEIVRTIVPAKDVDGFHPLNVGKLSLGEETLVACTPLGVVRLLQETGVDLEGKEAVIIGRSPTVGRPLIQLLLNENMTVTVTHSRTKDLAAHTCRADVVVAAVGRAHLVKGDQIKEGAVVIDVGINRGEDGKLKGDVDPSAAERASWLTPVPGGVGPMTIAMLLENTLRAQMLRESAGGEAPDHA